MKDAFSNFSLLLLQHADTLFHAVLHHNADHFHVPLLADAVHSINSLLLHKRVPPQVHQHHVVGGDQVQPNSSSPQRSQQDVAAAVVELLQVVLLRPNALPTVETGVFDVAGNQQRG